MFPYPLSSHIPSLLQAHLGSPPKQAAWPLQLRGCFCRPLNYGHALATWGPIRERRMQVSRMCVFVQWSLTCSGPGPMLGAEDAVRTPKIWLLHPQELQAVWGHSPETLSAVQGTQLSLPSPASQQARASDATQTRKWPLSQLSPSWKHGAPHQGAS